MTMTMAYDAGSGDFRCQLCGGSCEPEWTDKGDYVRGAPWRCTGCGRKESADSLAPGLRAPDLRDAIARMASFGTPTHSHISSGRDTGQSAGVGMQPRRADAPERGESEARGEPADQASAQADAQDQQPGHSEGERIHKLIRFEFSTQYDSEVGGDMPDGSVHVTYLCPNRYDRQGVKHTGTTLIAYTDEAFNLPQRCNCGAWFRLKCEVSLTEGR